MKRLCLALVLLAAALPAAAQDNQPTAITHHEGAHISIGHDYTVPRGTELTDSVVVIGGNVTVDGQVDDDVVVIGGNLQVGPAALIRGGAVSVLGHTTIDPKATVHGDVNSVGIGWPRWVGFDWHDGWWRVVAFGWAVMRLCAMLVIALLLTIIFPRSIGDVSVRIDTAPGASFLLGVVAEILFVPALVAVTLALVITIVGLPLLTMVPLLALLFAGVGLAGFTGAAVRLGASMRGITAPTVQPRVADLLLGFIAVTGCTIAGQFLMFGPYWILPFAGTLRVIGLIVEYLAWTIGLGAALIALFRRRRGDQPPPLPTQMLAPPSP